MSDSFDDLNQYINSQLATQDNNNQALTQAQKTFAESAIISVVHIAADYLEDKGIFTKTVSSIVKNSVNIIGTFGRCFGWW